jgi:hypothetical protein
MADSPVRGLVTHKRAYGGLASHPHDFRLNQGFTHLTAAVESGNQVNAEDGEAHIPSLNKKQSCSDGTVSRKLFVSTQNMGCHVSPRALGYGRYARGFDVYGFSPAHQHVAASGLVV